jgi:hypothetical protein
MKNTFWGFLLVSFFWSLSSAYAQSGSSINNINSGNWEIIYNSNSKCMDFSYKGQSVLRSVYVKIKNQLDYLKSSDYSIVNLSEDSFSDATGSGTKYTVLYTGLTGKPDIKQVFYMYPDRTYFLTEAYLLSSAKTSSNYMAPIMTDTQSSFLDTDPDNRVVSVPFDNDKWVRYSAYPLNKDSVSFEVTTVFSSKKRTGLVLGSVEHDTWKTGIRYSTSGNQYINKIECYGGITHVITNDINTVASGLPSKEHGSISGTVLKSPKVMVGMFDDWRTGMDIYGDVNAMITPPRPWTKGNVFGWNSWGGMADKVNYNGVLDVSDFYANNLQKSNFSNNGTVYIVLDSYWDNMTETQLKDFVNHCLANGQQPGIYWSPFSDWGENGDRFMEGSTFYYKSAYLYVNGKIRKIASRALDPTHPGTKARMVYFINKFKSWGFKYIKLDFLNNGILEADSYYDKNVTTGVQAYNVGMKYLSDLCGNDIYLGLSIAPLFPSQYGNGRRISCDAWGSADNSEYVLNSLSYGWWLDRVYNFNDPDNAVLTGFTEGENRMRMTSLATTGMYILGDNFSYKGTYPGTDQARQKALKFATNIEINEIAKLGRSFYPVEGTTALGADKAECQFMLKSDNCVYLAIYNYNANSAYSGSIDLSRLGLKLMDVKSVKELWIGNSLTLSGESLGFSVPAHDVQLFKLDLQNNQTSLSAVKTDTILVNVRGSLLTVQTKVPVKSVNITTLNGCLVKSITSGLGVATVSVNLSTFLKGVFLVQVITNDNKKTTRKIIYT